MGGRIPRHGDVEQILTLIESSSPEQQIELLQNMQKTDPAKAALLKVKMITVERVYSLDEESLGRVIESIDDDVFAYSLSGLDIELRKRALALTSNEKRKIVLDILRKTQENSAEVMSARRALINKARHLESMGKIHMGAVRSNFKKVA